MTNNFDQKSISVLPLKDRAGEVANQWLAKNRSLVLRQTPVWAQTLATLLIGLGGIALLGSILFKIDEVVTVKGQLKSIGGTVEVKTPAGGRVSQVFYEDGEFVEKGQKLLSFDTRKALSEKNTLDRRIELEAKQHDLQLKSLQSQLRTLETRKMVLNQRIATKTEILASMEQLVANGGFQRMQFLEQQEQLFSLKKQTTELDEQYSRLNLELDRTSLEYRKLIDDLKTRLKSVELQLQYQNVSAPTSGIVFDPRASVEGVISSGDRILSIVPINGLYAEVFVPNQDIGYIQIGQNAKVRIDAFPFSRYGELSGKILQIGAEALQPNQTQNFYRYPVKIKLSNSHLESQGVQIPLKSGMAITTNLKLREKRVISLISDVFVDQTDSIRSIRQQ